MNRRPFSAFTEGEHYQLMAPKELGAQLQPGAEAPLSAEAQLQPSEQQRLTLEMDDITSTVRQDAQRAPVDAMDTERFLRNGLIPFIDTNLLKTEFYTRDPRQLLPRLMTESRPYMKRTMEIPDWLSAPGVDHTAIRPVTHPSLDSRLQGGIQDTLRQNLQGNTSLQSGAGQVGLL